MERIIIRSSNWLGDAVMTVPAVRALKRGRPDARIAVLTPEKIADVWKLVPEVDKMIAVPAAKRGVLATARLLRGQGFTSGVIFPNSLRTALEMWLARIPRRAGRAGHSRRWLLTDVVDAATADGTAGTAARHQVHDYLRIAEFLGAPAQSEELFGFPDAAKKSRTPGAPVRIAICAGAEYGPAKRWLPERYAEVVRTLSAETSCNWQLVGTAKDRPVAEEIATLCESPANVENLCGKTTLAQLIENLRASDALLTNDTGTMHLAALLGTPVIAVFGSTEPALTGPLGAGHTVVRHHAECSPCFLRECPIDFRCMKDIESAAVVDALRKTLRIPGSV